MKVAQLKIRLAVEPAYALVHQQPGPGVSHCSQQIIIPMTFYVKTKMTFQLMDISVADPDKYPPGLYQIQIDCHKKALQSSTSYSIYTNKIFDDFFKPSVSLYCSCAGSLRGKGADGVQRASLPKEALDVFLGNSQFNLMMYHKFSNFMVFPSAEHCCSVALTVYEANEEVQTMKTILKKAINMQLQGKRKKKNFAPN
jgi:hypothetical protein